MFDSLLLFFILATIIPFFLAQIMPNSKWLIGYAICFGSFVVSEYYNHLTTPIEQRANGFVYALAMLANYLINTSGTLGIIDRAIVLYFKSRGYKINIWLIVNIIFLDFMLVYIAVLIVNIPK
ncbi:MAG: hypothetical protein RMZ42_07820 [Nostoc sp. DedQUE05]|uniref:hypothetical protein n=1 Tax=Nostoc sp. DedQUE05 TaxID=3075391 RepID=UPI002AD45E56|nr:hypothetical protein [Nostoc sp. DedQUE05]MDZ8091837.1 hypothetical protein [Nostoc sp. DedQUE05]